MREGLEDFKGVCGPSLYSAQQRAVAEGGLLSTLSDPAPAKGAVRSSKDPVGVWSSRGTA